MSDLSRVPPWHREAVLSRGEWGSCALERSCFGPMHDPTPAVPFHHLAVRLDCAPMKMGWQAEGRRSDTDLPRDHVSVIPADASVTSWWNRPVDFACLYFRPEALAAALGEGAVSGSRWEMRCALAVQAPALSGLIRAMARDAQRGQPYGKMAGESLFQQVAALLGADGRLLREREYKAGIGDRRVRRALDYIHAHFCEDLTLDGIALASETSPFHLSRIFRQTTGSPVWGYVARLRVRTAAGLMKDGSLSLGAVARLSGFSSYATFAATFVRDRGISPSAFRRVC